jgi:hypothetical protein
VVDGYRARLTPRNLVKNSSQRPVIHRPHHYPKDRSLWEFRAPTRHQKGGRRFSARSLPGPERSEARSARGRQPVKYGTNEESPEGNQDLPSKGTGRRGCARRTGGVRAINVPRGYKWRVVLIRAWPAPRTAPTQRSADTSTGSLTTFDSPNRERRSTENSIFLPMPSYGRIHCPTTAKVVDGGTTMQLGEDPRRGDES